MRLGLFEARRAMMMEVRVLLRRFKEESKDLINESRVRGGESVW